MDEVRRWRIRIFLSTALAYTCYYFGRKPFYVAKTSLARELHLDPTWLGLLGTLFLASYAIGQFLAGWGGTRWGPRRVVLTGMGVSLLCNLGMGLTGSWIILGAWLALNGLAQATGWPGNVATMANWFRRSERGTVMGFWCTNFQIGAGLATAAASWLLGRYGYPAAFYGGAGVVLLAMGCFHRYQRNRPQDVGLAPIAEEAVAEAEQGHKGRWDSASIRAVALFGLFYFFAKFIRYALWSWVPYLLHDGYSLSEEQSGYVSTIFDWAGLVGVIASGIISDRLAAGRRVRVCFAFTVGLTLACLALVWRGTESLVWFEVCLALIGFFLLGPDALVAGAAAIEAAPPGKSSTAAGIINGMGSLGAVLQELILGATLTRLGVPGFVGALFVSAGLALLSLGLILVSGRRRL